jgi:hypothetical protein
MRGLGMAPHLQANISSPAPKSRTGAPIFENKISIQTIHLVGREDIREQGAQGSPGFIAQMAGIGVGFFMRQLVEIYKFLRPAFKEVRSNGMRCRVICIDDLL